MLVPAQLYREELANLNASCFFKEKFKWFFAGERYELEIPKDCTYRRYFACLNEDNKIVGYFTYHYSEIDRRMRDFGIMSFVDGINRSLIKDVQEHIVDMFLNKGAISLEFFAFTDNPACKAYDRYMKKHGGRRVCELKNTVFFEGCFHNSYIYELQASDFKE